MTIEEFKISIVDNKETIFLLGGIILIFLLIFLIKKIWQLF